MLKDNLALLRSANGWSQEETAEKAGVSRQAYAKWEKGETVPDIEKCAALAKVYGITIDDLVNFDSRENGIAIPPPPQGKHLFGSVTVNERGQVLIPRAARDIFGISPGDRLILLGDINEGLALIKAEVFEARTKELYEKASENAEK